MLFNDANSIPVTLGLFWSWRDPSSLFSSSPHPHPSEIFLAQCTRCLALTGPTQSVHDRLHHADRLVRHWVGGVSLRICAHRCPAGPSAGAALCCINGRGGGGRPVHPITLSGKGIWPRPGALAAQFSTSIAWQRWAAEQRHHPVVVIWQNWEHTGKKGGMGYSWWICQSFCWAGSWKIVCHTHAALYRIKLLHFWMLLWFVFKRCHMNIM